MRHYVTAGGAYLGAFSAGVASPPNGIEVPSPPTSGQAVWSGVAWQEPAARWRVLRGTIVDRLIAAGLDVAAEAALTAAGGSVRRRWESRWWVWSDDPDAVAILTAIGATPAAILAPDPDAPL